MPDLLDALVQRQATWNGVRPVRSKSVTVTYLDGSVEKWGYVHRVTLTDGVLHLQKDLPYSGGYEHIASIPLASIRKYEIGE